MSRLDSTTCLLRVVIGLDRALRSGARRGAYAVETCRAPSPFFGDEPAVIQGRMCVREQLDRLWNTKRPTCVLSFLNGWIDALRWQRLTDMDRLGEFLSKHIEGIAAFCTHAVRFGVVDSINT
jgi:hypothetical protein